MAMNPLFFLATAAFGWGLSLATYRMVASRNGWPMGDPQAHHPLFVALLGIVALIVSFLFATHGQSGPITTGWAIIGLGLLFALFWTGFLRVASQTALFLAPLATFLLVLGWASTEDLTGDMKSVLADMKTMKEKVVQTEKNMEATIRERIQRARDERALQGLPSNDPGIPTVPPKGYQPQ
jgi:hypothetical protein